MHGGTSLARYARSWHLSHFWVGSLSYSHRGFECVCHKTSVASQVNHGDDVVAVSSERSHFGHLNSVDPASLSGGWKFIVVPAAHLRHFICSVTLETLRLSVSRAVWGLQYRRKSRSESNKDFKYAPKGLTACKKP